MIGLFVGLGSALTGTGGPVLLIPILLWLNFPLLAVVGLAQGIQIPIALSASTGNYIFSGIDFVLAGILSILLGIGVDVVIHLAVSDAAALQAVVLNEISSFPEVFDERSSMLFERRQRHVVNPDH